MTWHYLSGEPNIMPAKFQVVMDDLISAIRSGEYAPGDRLPSASQMRAKYGFSQNPIAMAIERLRAAGWVTTVPGSGVYVSERPPI